MAQDDYASQVARMRQQRQQEALDTDRRQAVIAYETALQERQQIEQEAAGVDAGDVETRQQLEHDWHYYDCEVERAEADLQRLNPPQPPPLSPQQQEFMRRAQPYVRKYGQQGLNNIATAHARALAVGLRENTQPYFDHIKNNLELNGAAKPEDLDELTPLQAAKASGLSWAEYKKQSDIYWDKKRRDEI
jgi:hypothetical protein